MSIADKLKTVAQKMEDVYRTGLFKYAPKSTASGESILLENSAPEPFVDMIAYGHSWQNETPTPTEPQPIESAKEVKVLGGNMANLPNVDSINLNGVTWSCKDGVVTADGMASNGDSNTIGTLSYSVPIKKGTYCISSDTPSITVWCAIVLQDGGWMGYNSNYNNVFTLDGTEQSCDFYLVVSNGVTVNTTFHPMLNIGTEALPFEPYKEPQTLTLPYELNGADGVYDEIDFERKKFIQRWLRFRPNKTLVFDSEHADTPNRYALYLPSFMDNYQPFAEVKAFCSRANWSAWGIEDGSFFIAHDGLWYRDLSKTIDEVNSIFAEFGTDIEFVAQLLEPIETDLTDEQIYAFKRLRANSPTTTIIGQGRVDVTYIVDNRQ